MHIGIYEKIEKILEKAESLAWKRYSDLDDLDEKYDGIVPKDERKKIDEEFNKKIHELIFEMVLLQQIDCNDYMKNSKKACKKWEEISSMVEEDNKKYIEKDIQSIGSTQEEGSQQEPIQTITPKIKELEGYANKSNFDEGSGRNFLPINVALPMKFYLPNHFSNNDFDDFYKDLGVTREQLMDAIADYIIESYKDSIKRTLGFCAEII